jgi:hypothetical protein
MFDPKSAVFVSFVIIIDGWHGARKFNLTARVKGSKGTGTN